MNKDYYRVCIRRYETEQIKYFYEQLVFGRSRQEVLNRAKMNLYQLKRRIGLNQNEFNLLWRRIYNTYTTMRKQTALFKNDKDRIAIKLLDITQNLPSKPFLHKTLNLIEERKKNASTGKLMANKSPFYICSSHNEPIADGHREFQGKIYINQNWREKVPDKDEQARIKADIHNHHIRTVEYILGPPVYLITRPNCKHTLLPVPIDEVLSSSSSAILKKHGLDNYEARQFKINVKDYEARLQKSLREALIKIYDPNKNKKRRDN